MGDQHLLGSVFTGAGAAVKEMDLGVKWTPCLDLISDPKGIGFILTQNTFLIINSQHPVNYENYRNIFFEWNYHKINEDDIPENGYLKPLQLLFSHKIIRNY